MRNAWKWWCWERNSFPLWRRWRTLLLSWPKQLMVTFNAHLPKLLTIPALVCFSPPMTHIYDYIKVFTSSLFPLSFPELLDCDDLHSVIRLVLKAGNYMNAVGIFLSELYCIWWISCNCFQKPLYLAFILLMIEPFIYYSGLLHCQCHWFQDGLSTQAGWHQSQQTWHEPHALCCQGEKELWDGQRLQKKIFMKSRKVCYHAVALNS